MKVLYTWVGNSDLQASKGNADKAKGPVADALLYLAGEIDGAVLLFDVERAPDAQARAGHYLSWLEKVLERAGKRLELRCETIARDDPTSFNWAFEAMRRVVEKHGRGRKIEARHYLVGPGTTTMAACTLIVARMAACVGTLWQADYKSPHGCRRLELPFALNLKDAPDPASHAAERAPGVQSEARHRRGEPIVLSPSTRRAWQLAERAASSDWPVLILGATGTGKEELARHIHRCRGRGKFTPMNCGAIPANLIESELFGYKKGAFTGAVTDRAGVFETAGDGIVFLDEVGELPLDAQARFLRVLQEKKVTRLGEFEEREVKCRIVAATHRDLWQAVRDGRFRADLYYRLAGLIITLDDLAERPEDLRAMIDALWEEAVESNPGFPGRELSEGARQRLLAHEWPGNVRELKAALVRAAFLAEGRLVSADDIELALGAGREQAAARAEPSLPATDALESDSSGADGLDFKACTKRFQRRLVQRALAEAAGHKSRAARLLGISVQHLGRLLKETGAGKPSRLG